MCIHTHASANIDRQSILKLGKIMISDKKMSQITTLICLYYSIHIDVYTQIFIHCMPLTHATAVIEVSFDNFAGLAVSVTHSAAVLFGRGADNAIAANFLEPKQKLDYHGRNSILTFCFC